MSKKVNKIEEQELDTVKNQTGKIQQCILDLGSLEVKKAEYVQGLKNMPVEEQRHLYFNGIGGFPGSSQAETDAAKAIGLDAEGFKKMNEPIDENNPKDVAEKTRLREQFQNQLNTYLNHLFFDF